MIIKSILKEIFEIVFIVFLAITIVIPIRMFLFAPFVVKGTSMEPSFSGRDYLIVEKISSTFKRGDVIVIKRGGIHFLKRIIGLPGEKIEIRDGRVVIRKDNQKIDILEELRFNHISEDMEKVFIGEYEFFVMGDNREYSYDSRKWGNIQIKQIKGVVVLRLFPLDRIDKF